MYRNTLRIKNEFDFHLSKIQQVFVSVIELMYLTTVIYKRVICFKLTTFNITTIYEQRIE